MTGRQELYGWKGLRELMALCAFQGALGLFFDVELWATREGAWSSLAFLALAGGAALFYWHFHLLVPTLVRFELVFMPMIERRLLKPSLLLLVGVALIAACAPLALGPLALGLIGVDVLLLSLVSFALAGLLFSLLRGERAALGDMQGLYRRFAASRAGAELSRLRLYLDQRAACPTPGMPIRGIEFPGLTSRPWHEPDSLPWISRLEAAYPMIREEISAALGQPSTELKQYRYLGVSSADWQSLMLLREPEGFIEENCRKLPQTMALLRSLPISFGREVMVSVLKPRSRIPAHRDSGNLTLTCQLGIQIPEQGCSIRVGRERRSWSPGKCIVFDTTYEHEVDNDSDQARVVLLFDFLHPDLTATELAFFEQSSRGDLSAAVA
jgi:aspartyl/asparaginyl beta-hydroxylase (cupin superfamily)